jgi:hypothetical protein
MIEINDIVFKQLWNKDLTILEPIVLELGTFVQKNELVINESDWLNLNIKYDKETLRDALTISVLHYKLNFPFEVISEDEVQKCFNSIRNLNVSREIIIPDRNSYKKNGEIKKKTVVEKFPDYKYSYEKCGICLINGNPKYNDVSDFFQSKNRHKCGDWSRCSTYDAWTTGKSLRMNLGALWRNVTPNNINRTCLKTSLRLSTYIASQFKPTIAKILYDAYKTEKVIDISCGWGDRLAGFYCSNAKEYYGFDPNPDTFNTYKEQCIYYEKMLGNEQPKIKQTEKSFIVEGFKRVLIQNKPAEDANYKLIPNDVDFVFSSPPYFSAELYGKGRCGEEDQSWCRYKKYDEWEKRFFHPVLEKCWEKLDENRGIMAINIVDVIIKNVRHLICERMIEHMTNTTNAQFVGQIGMKMTMRPNTRTDDIEFEQNNKIPFIEPIWVFKKALDQRDILCYNKSVDIEDLFE